MSGYPPRPTLIRDADPTSETFGQWFVELDANAHGGLGQAWWTPIRSHAHVFPDIASALAMWKTQSTVRPLRQDGKPNRPLTAYTITLDAVAE